MLSYVYAVGRGSTELDAAADSLTGIADGPVRLVTAGPLAAAVTSVPASDFDEEGFTAQLEDLERLEVVARAHHTVVDALADRTTVLPLRLATVYLDDQRVAGMLHDSEESFLPLLDRLEGHLEWGVKVYALPPQKDPGPADGAPEASASPGRAYLQRRRSQQARRREADRATGQAVARIRDAAAAESAARVAHRPQQGALAQAAAPGQRDGQGAGQNVANDSCLVPVERMVQFRWAVQEAARDLSGVHVEVTGPWAPYSFSEAPATAAEAPGVPR